MGLTKGHSPDSPGCVLCLVCQALSHWLPYAIHGPSPRAKSGALWSSPKVKAPPVEVPHTVSV